MNEASVMLLVSHDTDGAPRILFTRRAKGMNFAGGQVSFPGGSRDGEETPVETALRETCEEIGLQAQQITVRAELASKDFPRGKGFVVHPVWGTWSGDMSLVRPSCAEVASVANIPVTMLANPENRCRWERDGRVGGPMFIVEGLYIWGFTALITAEFLRAQGWERPWDKDQVISVPPDFQ